MSKIHFRDADCQIEKIFENIYFQKYVAEIMNSSNCAYRFQSFLAEVLVSLKYVQLIG
jgi:hypothetical protein